VTRYYLLRRVGNALLTILLIAALNFILFRLIPGDPTRSLLPRNVSTQQREILRHRLGLDQPLLPAIDRSPSGAIRIDPTCLPGCIVNNQFVTFMRNLLSWPPELGSSFSERKPVLEVIGERFWPTVLLVLTAEGIALVVGVLIGVRAGWKRGGVFDTLATNTSLLLYAVPLFWLGMLMFFFLATPNGVPLFPGQQMVTIGRTYTGVIDQALDIGAHLVLPATTLALGLLAQYALIMRSSLVEVLNEDYITTARAKGLKEGQVLRRHALPNAWLPTVSLIALTLGYTLGGAIGVEQVFSWPGLGRLTIEAVNQKDFPVLQGLFLLIAISVVVANLLADAVYGLLDPRVRTA
jgi:peptide/nickel transport system permease protein